jgi:PAS domain S-box-containing protein
MSKPPLGAEFSSAPTAIQTRNGHEQHTPASLDFLSGGGEMGALMRRFDWSATAIGPPEAWPQSLRSAISICLESEFQIAIYWGSELCLIYNDQWRQIPGDKHPWALGRAAHEVWPEIWDTVGPLFSRVLTTGKATRSRDALLAMHRRGFTEECYFDYTFSPIRDEAGGVGGVFNIVVETTFRVLEERRERLLRTLREAAAPARTGAEVCTLAAPALASDSADLPFCLIYLSEETSGGQTMRLGAATGVSPNSPVGSSRQVSPLLLDLTPGSSRWPIAEAISGKSTVIVENLGERFPMVLPGGLWPEPCERALVVPLPGLVVTEPAGVLIAGISPRLMLDLEYQSFIERIAGSLAAEIANARAYEQERKRAEALAEIDRAKTTFFSNISHEFRTPLTLMLGPLEDTLRQERSLSGSGRDHLELVHRNGLRLQKLVNALLDFSRLEAGRVQAVYEPANLSILTAELASNFRSACEKAGLELIVDCPPIPEPIYVDREMWEKIVLNLVSNAFKFTLEGRIRVSLRLAGPNVELKVTDTGSGIAEQELPHLFKRFHRVEGARGRSLEGSGIGLALVQELVKLHGGSVWVDSAVNQGSTFHVFIPRGSAHLPKGRIGASRTAASTAFQPEMFIEEALRWLSPSTSQTETADIPPVAGESHAVRPAGAELRGSVLLADDNADMREYVRRLLSERFDVTAVSNGEEALNAIREHVPDVVLTDVMMPGLDGFGLLRALRSDPKTSTIPVILLSARAGEESRVEGLDAGADDYLIKPFSARELLARVSSHYKITQLRKEALEAVRRSEAELALQVAEFETLFRELPVGVGVAHDADCQLIRINPALAELLGVPETLNPAEQRAKGSLPYRLCKDGLEIPLEHLPMQVATREGRTVRGFEFDVIRESGEARYEYGNAVPLFDDEGKVRGGIGVFLDITERKRAEEALRRSEAELRRANQELEQFAYAAAHDLQEPLRSVLIYSELLQRQYGGRLDAQADEFISFCRGGAKRMETLIRDLLTYAKASSTLDETVTPICLNAIVETVLGNLHATIEETKARITVGPLPFLTVGPVRFQQIFQNLIANSLRYHREGLAPEVDVSSERHDGHWIISVKDNGIGIDPQYHATVFGMFKRLHGQNQSGTGLGLSICQKIVERYGGRIWVESDPGNGSTFRFSLPLDDDEKGSLPIVPSGHRNSLQANTNAAEP